MPPKKRRRKKPHLSCPIKDVKQHATKWPCLHGISMTWLGELANSRADKPPSKSALSQPESFK